MKVFNWVFGSFFRTIGRTIALFVMAGIIYYLLASSGIDLKNLFLDNVKATSYTTTWISDSWYSTNWGSNWTHSTATDGFHTVLGGVSTTGHPSSTQLTWWKFDSTKTIPNNVKTLTFDVRLAPLNYNKIDLSNSDFNCTFDSDVGYPYGNLQDPEYIYFGQDCTFSDLSGTYTQPNFSLWVSYYVNDTTSNMKRCYATGQSGNEFTITCPVTSDNISGLVIGVDSAQALTYELGYYFTYTSEIDSTQQIIDSQNQNTEAITNQTQQQQQQHQEMMDSNTTQAESEASDFFGNFTQSDHGGLNSIVTAPLNTIRSLLSNSCTNLVLPLPFVNENITLPCMNDIYTTHFGLFFSLYQTIILAIISYRCIRSIFFDIHGFTDPDDDRIEVMDL